MKKSVAFLSTIVFLFLIVLNVTASASASNEYVSTLPGGDILLPMFEGDAQNTQLLSTSKVYQALSFASPAPRNTSLVGIDNSCLLLDQSNQILKRLTVSHPKLKNETSVVCGASTVNDQVIMAVLNYDTSKSYIAYEDVKGKLRYTGLLSRQIISSCMTEEGIIVSGNSYRTKSNVAYINPWVAMFNIKGELVWEHMGPQVKTKNFGATSSYDLCLNSKDETLLIRRDRYDGDGHLSIIRMSAQGDVIEEHRIEWRKHLPGYDIVPEKAYLVDNQVLFIVDIVSSDKQTPCLMKTDKSGNILWLQPFPELEGIHCALEVRDGFIISAVAAIKEGDRSIVQLISLVDRQGKMIASLPFNKRINSGSSEVRFMWNRADGSICLVGTSTNFTTIEYEYTVFTYQLQPALFGLIPSR